MSGMKVILSIASILAFVDSFGDCVPPTRKSGKFHLDYENFKQQVKDKAVLYAKDTIEDLFLDALSGVIQRVYLATDEIDCYVKSLNSANLIQIQRNILGNSSFKFPCDQTFSVLTNDKNALTEKLTELLNKLGPVNAINRYLLNMMIADMDGNTKINKNVFNQLKSEGKDIIGYTVAFEIIFKNFQMPTYMQHLTAIIRATKCLEHRKIDAADAKQILDRSAAAIDDIVPSMTKTVDFALKMNYNALYKSQQDFRDIAMKALNVKTFFGNYTVKSNDKIEK